jgi:hypothetical protein
VSGRFDGGSARGKFSAHVALDGLDLNVPLVGRKPIRATGGLLDFTGEAANGKVDITHIDLPFAAEAEALAAAAGAVVDRAVVGLRVRGNLRQLTLSGDVDVGSAHVRADALKKSFGGKMRSQISPFNVEKHKQARIGAGARVSANRELTCLKTLFNRCIDWRKFEAESPVRRVKLLKEPKNRLRFLSVEEESRLVAAASEPHRTIILVGIHSGLRIESEALKLTWPDVYLKRGDLTDSSGCIREERRNTHYSNECCPEGCIWKPLGSSPKCGGSGFSMLEGRQERTSDSVCSHSLYNRMPAC